MLDFEAHATPISCKNIIIFRWKNIIFRWKNIIFRAAHAHHCYATAFTAGVNLPIISIRISSFFNRKSTENHRINFKDYRKFDANLPFGR